MASLVNSDIEGGNIPCIPHVIIHVMDKVIPLLLDRLRVFDNQVMGKCLDLLVSKQLHLHPNVKTIIAEVRYCPFQAKHRYRSQHLG